MGKRKKKRTKIKHKHLSLNDMIDHSTYEASQSTSIEDNDDTIEIHDDKIIHIDFQRYTQYQEAIKSYRNIEQQIQECIKYGNENNIISACAWMEEFSPLVVPISWSIAHLVGFEGALLVGLLLSFWRYKKKERPPEGARIIFRLPKRLLRKLLSISESKLETLLENMELYLLVTYGKAYSPGSRKAKDIIIELHLNMIRKYAMADYARLLKLPEEIACDLADVPHDLLSLGNCNLNIVQLESVIRETQMVTNADENDKRIFDRWDLEVDIFKEEEFEREIEELANESLEEEEI